ncbi:MAG: MutS-related protein [Pseudobacter sp.]|uniref:MutS-related protein n=1 Tax=Pseudobacter sp. TaxID=2045420 RepID=UPI003F7FF555
MFLQTDDQTIEDLRLFAKKEQKGIYDIYNNTATRGGELLLEQMFRNPLSDLDAISRRTGIIASFAELRTSFPFDAALLDNVEKYLSYDKENSNTPHTRMGEKEIQSGVTAIISLFYHMREFLEKGDIIKVQGLKRERIAMINALEAPALIPIFSEKSKTKLSYAALTAFDILMRVKERQKITDVLTFIYQLDVLISVADVAVKRNFVFPVARPKGSNVIRIEGVFHPEVKKPVANSLCMDASRSVVFLTGANMAGKSTFLRSLSTAIYIAHMGFPVAAKSVEFSVMDGVYTTINLPDNLGIGASHFYAEVLRVKKMATELGAGKSLFVLFDELFRGTNVKDAHEGTVAIIKAFAGKKNSLFIISSHIVEAGEELKQKQNIGFYYLPTRMKGTVPEYTYTLEKGITDDRHGMIIIRNEGILETLASGKKSE